MKSLILTFSLLLSLSGFSQFVNYGFEVSPSWQLNTHYSKVTTLWSHENGYGFMAGPAFKFNVREYDSSRFDAGGIKYEFVAFDNWANNSLVSRFQMHSAILNMGSHFRMIGDFHINAGFGLKYIFLARYTLNGSSANINSNIRKFHPFVDVGASRLFRKSKMDTEIGIQIRYDFVQLFNKSITASNNFSSKLLAFDLAMRFYLKKDR